MSTPSNMSSRFDAAPLSVQGLLIVDEAAYSRAAHWPSERCALRNVPSRGKRGKLRVAERECHRMREQTAVEERNRTRAGDVARSSPEHTRVEAHIARARRGVRGAWTFVLVMEQPALLQDWKHPVHECVDAVFVHVGGDTQKPSVAPASNTISHDGSGCLLDRSQASGSTTSAAASTSRVGRSPPPSIGSRLVDSSCGGSTTRTAEAGSCI